MNYRLFAAGLSRTAADSRANYWPRLAIIAAVLLLSSGLAYLISPRQAVLVLALFGAAAAALVFLRWPSLGPLAVLAAALLAPFAVGTGTQTTLSAPVLLLPLLIGLWLFDMLVRQRRIWVLPSRPVLPLLLFVVVTLFSFLIGQLPWFPTPPAPLRAQLGGLAVFLLSAGAFLLVAHQMRSLIWLRRLTWLFLALGALQVAGRLTPGAAGRWLSGLIQPGATGSLFWTWLVALALSQAIFNRSLARGWRLALVVLALAVLYSGLFQLRSWASGWLPPLIAALTILAAFSPRLGLLASLSAGVVALLSLEWITNRLILFTGDQYSFITRVEAWRILAEIIKISPILGLGPANYYWYTIQFPILGWYVQFNSHNQYLDITAQTGLLGMACFLWFVWAVARLAWRLRRRVPSGFATAYVYGALGGLVGTLAAGMLGDWLLPFAYNVGLKGFRASVLGWLFLGGLVLLERLFPDNGQQTPAALASEPASSAGKEA